MKKIEPVLIIVFVLFSIQVASASTITFYGAETAIEDSLATTKLIVTFDSPMDKMILPINPIPKIIKASINSGKISCSPTSELGGGVLCNINSDSIGNSISLELQSALQEKSNAKSIFSSSYTPPLDTTKSVFSIKLPERATLSEEPPQNSISPRNGDIKTDGRHIIIFWNRNNISAGDIISFSASYTLPEQRDSPINTFLIIPIIVFFAAIVWLIIKHKKTTKTVEQTAAVSVLSQDEKTLFDILKAHEGKVVQKVLVRESNFSKAKVSRLLKDLKERNVIEIEPVSGRENRVILKLGHHSDKNTKQEKVQQPEQSTQPDTQV